MPEAKQQLMAADQISDSNALMTIIATASQRDDFDVDKIEKLLQIKEKWDAMEARKAFVAAMAQFKAENITITKDKDVSFGQTKYSHASIGNVVEVVTGALGKHGLSHRWDIKQEDKLIRVTCIITHKLGHSESTSLEGLPDTSGNKNAIQQVASTVSYLERYTLLAATGLATKDQEDTDGNLGQTEGETQGYAENLITDWLAAIEDCADITALDNRRSELINAFGSAHKVPASIKRAINDKRVALEAK